MDSALRQEVWRRAESRCEYCRIPQNLDPLPFQLDHIIADQHGGLFELDNLALACLHCNKHKGPNIATLDPLTGQLIPLFHPRQNQWTDHFQWQGPEIMGRTAVGRGTVRVLNLNDPAFVAFREALIHEGVFP